VHYFSNIFTETEIYRFLKDFTNIENIELKEKINNEINFNGKN